MILLLYLQSFEFFNFVALHERNVNEQQTGKVKGSLQLVTFFPDFSFEKNIFGVNERAVRGLRHCVELECMAARSFKLQCCGLFSRLQSLIARVGHTSHISSQPESPYKLGLQIYSLLTNWVSVGMKRARRITSMFHILGESLSSKSPSQCRHTSRDFLLVSRLAVGVQTTS